MSKITISFDMEIKEEITQRVIEDLEEWCAFELDPNGSMSMDNIFSDRHLEATNIDIDY